MSLDLKARVLFLGSLNYSSNIKLLVIMLIAKVKPVIRFANFPCISSDEDYFKGLTASLLNRMHGLG